jgi:hypothetical protein
VEGCGLDSYGMFKRSVASFCRHGNEHYVSIIVDYLNNC